MPSRPARRFFLCTGQCVTSNDIYKDMTRFSRSHIIGELRYVTYEGRKVTALAIYEKPVSAVTVPPVSPVIVDYTLLSPIIKCRFPYCTRSQRWEIGKSGMLALMEKMGLQEKYLEIEKGETHEPVA